ncbi:MAG TPA: thiamine pyrophosphate-binding protein, partial [Chloroflexota bacterium]|nr:thiamine pyrophosphate-binding protein [Chloroflexota bacterium]
MKVYEALAEAFAAEGTNDIFGLMGDGNMYWMAALERHRQMTVFEARHEGASLAMADGWARAKPGEVGVCAVTCGPGLAQLATSLIVAARANTPIVVFAGDSPTNDPEYVQKMEQQKFIEACEAGFVPLINAEEAHEAVRTAFYRAKLESRPIVFNAPMDIQMYDFPGDDPYQPSSTIAPAARVQPDPARLEAATKLIEGSRKPVIVAGRGAVLSGAREEIRALGSRIGALLATSLLAKGWFAGEEFDGGISGLYGTRAATELFADADLVIGVGATLNNYTTEHGYVFPEAKYIHIDVKPHARMGHSRAADVYLQADAKAGVAALDALLASRGFSSTGYRTPETREALQGPIDRATWDIEPGRVDPREAAEVMDELLPVDIPLIVGGGHFVSFPVMHMTRPGRANITTIQWGCIGQGVGTAIGAAVAYGGKPTLLVDG